MALPDYGRIRSATEKTFRSTGGTAVINCAALASGAARQSDKLDFGATRAPMYAVFADVELSGAQQLAGNVIPLYLGPSSSSDVGTDNLGGLAGVDSAYAGYSSNLTAAISQLPYIGDFVTTTQTGSIQKGFIGYTTIPTRYAQLVVYAQQANFAAAVTGTQFRFVPIEDVVEDT